MRVELLVLIQYLLVIDDLLMVDYLAESRFLNSGRKELFGDDVVEDLRFGNDELQESIEFFYSLNYELLLDHVFFEI